MQKMLRTLAALSAFTLVAVCATAIAQATSKTPETDAAAGVVERLHAALLDAMQNADTLGYAGRYQQLKPVIESSFDLPALAQSSVRGHWEDFSKEQQQQFLADFSRLSIATYAQRFDGYDGESFKTLESNEIARGNRRVKTHLVKRDGEKISLDYVLVPDTDTSDVQWRIVNVIAQGVSDLALKRSQYVGVLKKQGVEEFLKRIRAQVKALPSQDR